MSERKQLTLVQSCCSSITKFLMPIPDYTCIWHTKATQYLGWLWKSNREVSVEFVNRRMGGEGKGERNIVGRPSRQPQEPPPFMVLHLTSPWKTWLALHSGPAHPVSNKCEYHTYLPAFQPGCATSWSWIHSLWVLSVSALLPAELTYPENRAVCKEKQKRKARCAGKKNASLKTFFKQWRG